MKEAKAIRIKESNKQYLADRFCEDEEGVEDLTVGFFLVAPFDSQDRFHEILSFRELVRLYKITGKMLKNGFFQVVKKA